MVLFASLYRLMTKGDTKKHEPKKVHNVEIMKGEELEASKPISRSVSIMNVDQAIQLVPASRNRKRPRSESSTEKSPHKTVSFSSLQAKKSTNVLKDNDEHPTISSSSPPTVNPYLHVPIACKSKEHILLNENSLEEDPGALFTPASPVRSVVSCDGSQVDLDDDGSVYSSGQLDNLDVIPEECALSSSSSSLPDNLQLHINALHIEASLGPMKPLLSRLMIHPGHNRKGTFNVAVDPVALGLKDYTSIVKHPMDLGTVKKKLNGNIYRNHEEVASDIRLCFRNALIYNPKSHPVHEAAEGLLLYFEKGYKAILNEKKEPSMPVNGRIVPMQHTCQSCLGRVCKICNEKCLPLEPTLVICSGAQCVGSKIRRGIIYHCSPDGTKAWCHRCFVTLPVILPSDTGEKSGTVQYKKDLLKRRNEEVAVERWLTCKKCGDGVHECCALANEFNVDRDTFECSVCSERLLPKSLDQLVNKSSESGCVSENDYSFISGQVYPAKVQHSFQGSCLDCRSLPSCPISEFIQYKLQQRMIDLQCPPHAEKTITVRVISDCTKNFHVPEMVKRHFRSSHSYRNTKVKGIIEAGQPSTETVYQSKAIALFQRFDGMDVCLFCMYVHEYEEDKSSNQKKRVYIGYIDSVEYFRPQELRTYMYHEIVTSYLATARARGFECAHIWSCPPSRGNSFVFWAHPSVQRTPTKDHLRSWYHRVICHGLENGIITNVTSLYESSFQDFDVNRKVQHKEGLNMEKRSIMPCPPLLEGDFWIEEVSRLCSSSIAKFFRTKNSKKYIPHERFSPNQLFQGDHSLCPAMHVVTVLRHDIMLHPSAAHFCKPVNATSLNLVDYHDIIKKPMDLGTVTIQCLLGEYDTFVQVVEDVELVFNNAMKYNPPGHFIHTMASDLLKYSQMQFETLTSFWRDLGVGNQSKQKSGIRDFSEVSMKLGAKISSNHNRRGFQNRYKEQNKSQKVHQGEASNLTPELVAKYMVGEDIWLLDKRHTHKSAPKSKQSQEKNKHTVCDGLLKHHESWLGDEMSKIVKRLRADFFVCNLLPNNDDCTSSAQANVQLYQDYISDFDISRYSSPTNMNFQRSTLPLVSDARYGLLEFSQYRNFQFDTLRRAKYSTAMMLLYLQNHDVPGIIPTCTSCKHEIKAVRWRKVHKAFDERRRSCQKLSVRMTSLEMDREDLCSSCYEKLPQKENHIPIVVTFKSLDDQKNID